MRRFKSMTSNSSRRAQQDQHVWIVGRVQHLDHKCLCRHRSPMQRAGDQLRLLRAVRASLMIVMRTVMVVVWICVLIGPVWADETVTVNYASVIGPVTYKGSGYLHSFALAEAPPDSLSATVKPKTHRSTVNALQQSY